MAQSCQQLWVERNQYYKNHGYCFKTQQAIAYFGNGGCFSNEQNAVPLSSAERARVKWNCVCRNVAVGPAAGAVVLLLTACRVWNSSARSTHQPIEGDVSQHENET